MDVRHLVAWNLRRLRVARGISQDELALQADVERGLGQGGAAGDRLYGLVDVESGEVAAPDRNVKWHKVPRIRTRLLADGRLEIAVPGGDWVAAPGSECNREISVFLGFNAAIRPFPDENGPGCDGPSTAPRYEKAPVHLLTTASLARLKALHPEGIPDPRRFRPTILVDMPEGTACTPRSLRSRLGRLRFCERADCRG